MEPQKMIPPIRHFIPALVAFAITLPAAYAASFDDIQKNPATVEVAAAKPVPLVESDDKLAWQKVPPQLSTRGATIFIPVDKHNGVSDFKVTADGWVIIACNFDYQGNKGGNWDEMDWDERKFRTKGWDKFTKGEMGGLLVKGDGREQIVYAKLLKKGTALRLRCNKYDPPYIIILSKPAAK
jgi:hypothetical protein